jgi:hypothetical protein
VETKEQKNRKKALEWWSTLAETKAFGGELSKQYMNEKYHINRDYSSFTGREIEEIWKEENQYQFSSKEEADKFEKDLTGIKPNF